MQMANYMLSMPTDTADVKATSTPLIATRTCTQQERKDHVQAMCAKLKQQHNVYARVEGARHMFDGSNSVLVRDSHQLAWCRIPKAASSTITTLLMAAHNIPMTNDDIGRNSNIWRRC